MYIWACEIMRLGWIEVFLISSVGKLHTSYFAITIFANIMYVHNDIHCRGRFRGFLFMRIGNEIMMYKIVVILYFLFEKKKTPPPLLSE